MAAQENLDNLGNTLSKEQEIFFKNSKVRDSQGKLLVCYHGSNYNFTEFSNKKVYWFTSSEDISKSYRSNTGFDYAVYLNITDMFTYDCKGNVWSRVEMSEELLDIFNKQGLDTYYNRNGKYYCTTTDIVKAVYGLQEYNGVCLESVADQGAYFHGKIQNPVGNDYIVFNSNQIKSISNKTPTKSNNINEGYDISFVKNQYRRYINNFCRNLNFSEEKVNKIVEEQEYYDVLDFLNKLKFPLTVYRGLRVNNSKDINLDNIGTHWTVDTGLFSAKNSVYKAKYVVIAEVTEDMVDFPNTISNYISYSGSRPKYGFYPENEITLKSNAKPLNPRVKINEEGKLRDLKLEEGLDHAQRAVKEFGTTYTKSRAGYLLKDGRYLDLTYGGQGSRDDHRSISSVFDEIMEYPTDYMLAFMQEGNIRLIPEIPGIDLMVEPTEQQYETLQDYISYFIFRERYFAVDYTDSKGYNVQSLEYEYPTRANQIINDIKEHFKG